ncbi:MAG: DNA mismatch repair endonuclease MutL [Chitinispirillaceae bacterium]
MQHDLSSIEILPLPVVEKIAAGEVIERPASVLKELIENAIDADASAIGAVIEDAGFSRIKVTDNGRGMLHGDLGKCLLRHATSKIRSAEDLFTVRTMGFRGEALASIAAVSRLNITTSADKNGLGSHISSEGGVHGIMQPASHGRGTSVEVCDLFYNVPARKKFMKSRRSEQQAALRVVEQIATAFPSIHFTLNVDADRVLDLPPVDSLIARIGSVAGTSFAKGLIECRSSRPGIEAVIYISSPEVLQARPRYQSLYVNSRRVDSDAVTYAVRGAFEQFISSKYRPSFFCFVKIDPSRIDVNVHPTKQEIKFDDERSLSGFIFSAVKQGVSTQLPGSAEVLNREASLPQGKIVVAAEFPDEGAIQEQLHLTRKETAGAALPEPGRYTVAETIIPFPSVAKNSEQDGNRADAGGIQSSKEQQDRETAWDLISCYQIHETYILAPIKKGILLIDQHAAHERILFEQALADIAQGRSASQQLLFPVVIELTAVEKPVITAGMSFFAAFGFDMSDFGGNSFSVSAIPFFMRTADVEEAVRSMVRYLLGEKERDMLREPEKRFAAAFACSAAIKAGQRLSQEEMNALVNNLFATKNPYTCPHGRPTLVRISLNELSRRFLRSGV